MIDFCKKENIKQATVITKGVDKTEKTDEMEIKFVSIWNWLLSH